VIHPAVVVDKYQTVAFDTNRYSVPRPFAFQMVTVKGYVDKVVIVAGGQAVATHARPRQRHTAVLDPRHYLATLGRKPGALDSAPVFRDWELPACVAGFRAALEDQHGTTTGARHFARVLQLLGDHPLRRVRDAVESCRDASLFSAEAVIRRVQVLAAVDATRGVPSSSEAAMAPPVHVPRPDLSRFDLLLGRDGDPEPPGVGDTAPERQVSVFFA
jgi:Mu transposase-like protein